MNKEIANQIVNGINTFRSLSFGGIVGMGIAGILFLSLPQFFSVYVTFYLMLSIGGAVGACIHRFIDAVIVRGMINPARKRAEYYSKIIELEIQHRQGYIDHQDYKRIKSKLDDHYFLFDIEVLALKPKIEDELKSSKEVISIEH